MGNTNKPKIDEGENESLVKLDNYKKLTFVQYVDELRKRGFDLSGFKCRNWTDVEYKQYLNEAHARATLMNGQEHPYRGSSQKNFASNVLNITWISSPKLSSKKNYINMWNQVRKVNRTFY